MSIGNSSLNWTGQLPAIGEYDQRFVRALYYGDPSSLTLPPSAQNPQGVNLSFFFESFGGQSFVADAGGGRNYGGAMTGTEWPRKLTIGGQVASEDKILQVRNDIIYQGAVLRKAITSMGSMPEYFAMLNGAKSVDDDLSNMSDAELGCWLLSMTGMGHIAYAHIYQSDGAIDAQDIASIAAELRAGRNPDLMYNAKGLYEFFFKAPGQTDTSKIVKDSKWVPQPGSTLQSMIDAPVASAGRKLDGAKLLSILSQSQSITQSDANYLAANMNTPLTLPQIQYLLDKSGLEELRNDFQAGLTMNTLAPALMANLNTRLAPTIRIERALDDIEVMQMTGAVGGAGTVSGAASINAATVQTALTQFETVTQRYIAAGYNPSLSATYAFYSAPEEQRNLLRDALADISVQGAQLRARAQTLSNAITLGYRQIYPTVTLPAGGVVPKDGYLTRQIVHASSPPTGGGIPAGLVGTWGGNHISMNITASGATLEFDGAHATMSSLNVNNIPGYAGFSFTGTGTYTKERAGPLRPGDVEDIHPAIYTGTLMGNRMTFSVRLTDTNEVVGPYDVIYGQPGNVVKIL